VNDKTQLAEAEKHKRKQAADRLLQDGVTLADPERIDVRGELICGKDVFIDVNVVFEGNVKISEGSSIGPHSVISNTTIGKHTKILSHCNLEHAIVGNDCSVGPFARLRPGTELMDSARAGNFVEIKKSQIGQQSKVNHLSYIGDAVVGKEVNIGAGTITCNYDGVKKYKTTIGDHAFIGTNNSLVAPIKIGRWAVTAAGTAVNKDVPDYALVVRKGQLVFFDDWAKEKFKIEEGEDAK